jgi:GNAT superfamily N-acetyltransferase
LKNAPQFCDADPVTQYGNVVALTQEYFEWMNAEIVRACAISIPDLVGKTIDEYVRLTMQRMSTVDPREGTFHLVMIGNEAVAMGGLRRLPDGAAEIVRIYTRPAFRGRGYGRKIMDHLIARARDLDYLIVRLDTAKFMHSAHRIYYSLGFKDCQPYAGAEPPDQLKPIWLYMEKDLAGSH